MNAICSGLFIDRVEGPVTFVDGMPLPSMGDTRYDPPPGPTGTSKGDAAHLAAATALWNRSESNQIDWPGLAREQKITAYRLATAAGPDALAGWRWQLQLWNNDDRKSFDAVTTAAWASFAQQMGINQASVR
jgi:hypothetical protein